MDSQTTSYNMTFDSTTSGMEIQEKGQAHLCGAIRSFQYRDFTQLVHVWWIFVVLYIAVMVLSLLGNLMVIWTICRHKYMRTVTNYYILNLAVCDFLISAIVMPLKLTEYTGTCTWQLVNVDALCSALFYVLPVFVFASVFTLVAISIERYHAIVHPLESRQIHSQARTVRILICTWLAAFIVPTPYLYCKSFPFSIESELGFISRRICTDRFDDIDVLLYGAEGLGTGSFRRGYFAFLFLAIYVIPVIIIVCTCARISIALLKPFHVTQQQNHDHIGMDNRVTRRQEENKRKVARMIIIVSLTFILSWTPFYMVTLISQVQSNSFLRRSNFLFTMLSIHLCGFLNSSINPFIYHTMSDRFRRSFKDIWAGVLTVLCCGSKRFRKSGRHYSASETSTRTWTGNGTDNTVVTMTFCNSDVSNGNQCGRKSNRAVYSALALSPNNMENNSSVSAL